jgi:dienelactone hydrolase
MLTGLVKRIVFLLSLFFLSIKVLNGQDFSAPDTVSVPSGNLVLKGLIWRPSHGARFPAIIFCHGSIGGLDTVHNPLYEVSLLGPLFASRGYIFLALFRRGAGLSKGQGTNSTDLMDDAFKEGGQEARNKVQLQQLETDQLQDVMSGIAFLRDSRYADKNRIAIVGHSFGASLSLIVAGHTSNLKAVVAFSPGGYSWDRSSQLRAALTDAVKHTSVPVMIIHAENDYSINPGRSLDSVMNQLHNPHALKLYPKFGNSPGEGHALIYDGIDIWEPDVFNFLNKIMAPGTD